MKIVGQQYQGAGKSLARPGRKQVVGEDYVNENSGTAVPGCW